MRVGDRQQLVADREQDLLDLPADASGRAAACTANGTRSAAARGPSRSSARCCFHSRRSRSRPGRARARRSRAAFAAYAASCAQQVAVVLDHHAAAAGGDDDRLDAAMRRAATTRRCCAARASRASSCVVQVMRQRAAAAAAGDAHRRDADAIEHARHRGVDVRRERRLHAAFEHQHPPRWRGAGHAPAGLRRPECDRASSRGSRPFASRPSASAPPNSGCATAAPCAARSACARFRRRRGRPALSTIAPADVDQPAVLHAGRTGRLAAAAREAAIEVQLRLRGDRARPRAPA